MLAHELSDVCTKYSAYPIVICGDLNYPGIDWQKHSFPRALQSLQSVIDIHSLSQHIRQHTRCNAILDVLLSNEDALIGAVDYSEPFHNSDHVMIQAVVRLSPLLKPASQPNACYSRCLRNADWLSVSEDLMHQPWRPFWDALCVDRRWEILLENVTAVMDKHFPLRPTAQRIRKPRWYDGTIYALRRNKSKLWRRYRALPTVENLNQYRKSRNKYTTAIRNAQCRYEKRIATECGINPRLFYRYANERTRKLLTVPPMQLPNGLTTSNDEGAASALNHYFASVFTAAGAIQSESYQNAVGTSTNVERRYGFDVQRIRYQLITLDSNKATGPDGVPPLLLKRCSYVLAPLLTALFNMSLDLGIVPRGWKLAHVVPIFKGGPPDVASNYRPISLTPCACKIMERSVSAWLDEHLRMHSPLRSSQHGFAKGQSCTSQLLEYLDDVTQSVDSGNAVDAIYIDFAKAFDKVDHSLLIQKLVQRSVPTPLVRWIASFLLQRQQRVVVGSACSDWTPVGSGVPQGSVLGPLLFNIFVDDLDSDLLPGVKIKKFADDTKLYVSYSLGEATAYAGRLQSSLDAVTTWCEVYKMKINVQKCCVLHFGSNNPRMQYTIDGAPLSPTASVRDLGVMISETLKPSIHCSAVASKARRLIGLLLRTFKSRKSCVLLPLYKTLIRPILEYASPAWNSMSRQDAALIEGVQHLITKCITDVKELSYNTRLQMLKLPTLESRRHYFDLLECYRVTHNLVRSTCSRAFTRSRLNTRGCEYKLASTAPIPRLNTRKSCFTERTIVLWNHLPQELAELPTYAQFRCALRLHLCV